MIQKVLFSLLVTLIVSGLLAFLFANHWVIVFFLSFTLQILFFYIGNTIYENKLIEKAERIRTEQIKEATKLVATVECPCGEHFKQDTVIRFDEELTYKCDKCDKIIKLNVDVKPVLTTQPIYTNR
jgi:predicted membrane protein